MDVNVGVIGGGSLGTAISQMMSNNVRRVTVYVRKREICDDINQNRCNSQYYSNVMLNENIVATTSLDDLAGCDIIFLAIPSSAFRQVLEGLKGTLGDDAIIVTTAKGIEFPSLKTMGSIVEEYFGENYVALSGPNFASEIMLNLPTVTNVASKNPKNAAKVRKVLSTPQFKVKIIDDVCGIELCGILKNVNAIANGLCEGMNINENAKFAIMTQGFNDTMRILEAVGGKAETVNEYCGFGDLILTSTSTESRNHTLGILYGQRLIIDENASGVIFEGKNSIRAIRSICEKYNVESHIVDFVYAVLIDNVTPVKAFKRLWENIED